MPPTTALPDRRAHLFLQLDLFSRHCLAGACCLAYAGVGPTLEQLAPYFNITVLHEDPPVWQFDDFLTAEEIEL